MWQNLKARDLYDFNWENLFRGLFALRRFELRLLFFWALWMMNPDCLSLAGLSVEGGGPFPTRNYNPVQLLFLSLPAEKATALPRGSYELSLEVAESNSILIESTSRIDALLKFETFRSALHIKYGLTNQFEIGLEIPYFYRNGGFLDPLIIRLEHDFGHLNRDRNGFADGSFGGFTIKRDGKIILSGGDHQAGPGDLVFSGKFMVLQEDSRQPAIALRGAIKLRTGDFDRAFGSGKPDLGIGLVFQKTLSRRWIFYLNQNVVIPEGHFGTTDLSLTPFYSSAVALEFLGTSFFSIVGQFDYYSTPFHETGVHLLDHGVAEAVLGFNDQISPQLLWQLYGIENFAQPAGAAADFTLGTNMVFRF